MKALTYIEHNHFALLEKPEPEIIDPRDAIVRVTLGSICTSDLHIKHGSVPRAVPGITVGHEMVGVVESVGAAVKTVRPGERGNGKRGDLLRRVLLLPARLGEQLHRPRRRLGFGLSHRRRAGGACPGALCRSGTQKDSRQRHR